MYTKESLLKNLKALKRTEPQDNAEFYTLILSALKSLPYKQKEVIFNFYIRDEKWDRIAVQNKCSITACKQIRDKALDALLRKLNEKAS